MTNNDEMQAILDQALDDLDDDRQASIYLEPSSESEGSHGLNFQEQPDSSFGETLKVIETDVDNIEQASTAFLDDVLNQVHRHSPDMGAERSNEETHEFAASLAAILEEMEKSDVVDPRNKRENDRGGKNDATDPDDIINGMMQQLLSKDLMYEPMMQVAKKFPNWLQEHEPSLSAEDLERYKNQSHCFQRLVNVYETNPDDLQSLLELMQEAQEYGQPPQEIISEIAPELKTDDNGMPNFAAFEDSFRSDGECPMM